MLVAGSRLRGVAKAVVASRPAARTDFMAAMISWLFSCTRFCEYSVIVDLLVRGESCESEEQRKIPPFNGFQLLKEMRK